MLSCKIGLAFELDPSDTDKERPESRSLPKAHSSAAATIFLVPNLGKGNPLLSPITQSDLLLWGKMEARTLPSPLAENSANDT